ncbi:SulP family inorganic anion transporter [Arthrobacter sp. B2a2-09]|uniref:SulP family inorganic anion transporter n=1 Tax=Arthrobacter sp. B2a2-09 TaxID=2952822 RepID=UPI0022CD8E24|nr:SulP family inorganic anion transporter [Arthrobacter sp. B2a2-09]MCZ9881772.1 SulP family inorganic anion transporter [Arthrobacter sp. B2a2-09]
MTGGAKEHRSIAGHRSIDRRSLLADLGAGASLCVLLVPAGMAYSLAAGLPPVAGLYASITSLLVYGALGPSKVLILGPDSSLAPLIAAAVLPLAAGDPRRAVSLAGLLSLLVGAILVLGFLLRMGFLGNLLSKPIRTGYLAGIALVITVNQLPGLLGLAHSSAASGVWGQFTTTLIHLGHGDANLAAALISAFVLTLLVVTSRSSPRWRMLGVLGAVAGSMLAGFLLRIEGTVPMVGALPGGWPFPALDRLGTADIVALAGPAAGIALLAFADTTVLSRTLALRHGNAVDGGREMLALGSANAAAGLFGGFPVSASTSRTPVAIHAGARTRFAGIFSALFLLAFMQIGPGATRYLPSSVLSAVVMVAAASMIDSKGISALFRSSLTEAALMTATFAGVVFLGVLTGVLVAVGLSLAVFVGRAIAPYRTELVLVEGVPGFHDATRHPEGSRIPGLAIVRFDAPLFFANGQVFVDHVRSLVELSRVPVRGVIVAAEAITGIDSTAVEQLVQLDEYLQAQGTVLVFAELKGPIKDKLARFGPETRLGQARHYPTLESAVDALRQYPDSG